MAKTEKLIGEVTPDQIQEWKKTHGQVYALIVDGHICYVRKPKRTELAYAQTLSEKNPIKSNEVLLKSMWLGGSEAIQNDDEKFFGASGKLSEIISIKEAELVNL